MFIGGQVDSPRCYYLYMSPGPRQRGLAEPVAFPTDTICPYSPAGTMPERTNGEMGRCSVVMMVNDYSSYKTVQAELNVVVEARPALLALKERLSLSRRSHSNRHATC